MPAKSICYSPLCGHSVEGNVRDCPQCGKRMRQPKTVRILGIVMFLCGLFITVLIGVIFSNMSWMLGHPGEETLSRSRFTGTAEQADTIRQLFWLLIAFGLAAMLAGLWQAITARRDRIVVIGVLLLAAVLFLFARQTKLMLS